ncbi:MAG: glycoside hydrolase family 127 protein [Planctomycetota bacterium]|nr:glycoside hydrolase family 127 protein [Planctomycetota bacterium]
MKSEYLLVVVAVILVAHTVWAGAAGALQAVPFTDVKVDDAFWAPRIKINREKVLPVNFKFCETTGRISNFAKAGGLMQGKFEGIYFNDSDVYKVLEGAAYSLAHQRDAELEKLSDDVIAKIASAQQPDGYLYSFYTVRKELNKRWSNEKDMHETYCAGHLIEAAVAYFQATGKRAFLDVAIKLADHIDSIYGPEKKHDSPGHEEIELALVKLYRQTNQEKYLKLAQFFVEERGQSKTHKLYGDYCQDHKPVREQHEIVGHAVRAMYLYSAVADLAAATGDKDYIATMDAIWKDVTERKMYITGGIGPSAHNEGFTVPYDLPNDSAYCETCAAIGMALWNQRLALLHADARYADIVELEMYNGVLSGVSLDGGKFFYVNPLASRGKHHRQEWFGCSCCPTNVVRFLPTVGGYAYAYAGQSIYVNQYVAGSAKVALGGNAVTLKQETRYPWDGAVKITMEPQQPAALEICLRIPGWCDGVTLKVNGQAVEQPAKEKGYARLKRDWKSGDTIELTLPMPVKRVYADPNVKADIGRVALKRGPIVYCLEGVDNDGRVRHLCLPKDAALAAEERPDLLGGVAVVKGKALAVSRKASAPELDKQETGFLAVPYYAWDNRTPGQMIVWLAEDPAVAELLAPPTLAGQATSTASHVHAADAVEALNDGVVPASSGDLAVPRFTWWDHKGTAEWVQYDFKAAKKCSTVEVYWFDDTGKGQCRVPKSCKLLYKDGNDWKPVENAGEFGTKVDIFNRVTFKPVETIGLRIEVQLQPGFSGGILEWRVTE